MLSKKLLSAAKAVEPVYVEDVFQSWLRTGTGSSQTITTGVKENTGALVITKSRSAATNWAWYDTARGANKSLQSNLTNAQTTETQGLTSFNADGHTWGTLSTVNTNGATYVDYVLKPQPKFFDVVTYTGNGVAGRQIPHSLGVAPGMIIVKKTNVSGNGWAVYHRSTGNNQQGWLNTTDQFVATGYWNNTTPDATSFYVGANTNVNNLNATYVAYLFAHDAGGFGDDGNQNVISCGSVTNLNTLQTVNLGWEPQFILTKNASAVEDWKMFDSMRGIPTGGADAVLYANLSNAESNISPSSGGVQLTSTGFTYRDTGASNSNTVIYIAIRRGPMKVPTDGTKVFSAVARTGTGANSVATAGFPVDTGLTANRGAAQSKFTVVDRLRGAPYQVTSSVAAEVADTTYYQSNPFDVQTGLKIGSGGTATNASSNTYIDYFFRRAPGFFDVVCYTGTGVARTVTHNLAAVPELMIVSRRDSSSNGKRVYSSALGNQYYLTLNENFASSGPTAIMWNNATPTSSAFTVGTYVDVNASGSAYIAHLAASCPGVSKIGTYTGTGTTLQIDCGFTAGARFVLIKRTDSTGDWYVWDSARGIVAGNDPYLLLNSTAAEVTSTDYIDTYSQGFEISSTAPAAINANNGTFIFLAIS